MTSSSRVSAVSGVARSTRRGAAASSAAYMAASPTRRRRLASLAISALADQGVSRATTEAAASRGEMELAISSGVVPAGTSRIAPSGSCTAMVCVLMVLGVPGARPEQRAAFSAGNSSGYTDSAKSAAWPQGRGSNEKTRM